MYNKIVLRLYVHCILREIFNGENEVTHKAVNEIIPIRKMQGLKFLFDNIKFMLNYSTQTVNLLFFVQPNSPLRLRPGQIKSFND